jgi:hypothetical protein
MFTCSVRCSSHFPFRECDRNICFGWMYFVSWNVHTWNNMSQSWGKVIPALSLLEHGFFSFYLHCHLFSNCGPHPVIAHPIHYTTTGIVHCLRYIWGGTSHTIENLSRGWVTNAVAIVFFFFWSGSWANKWPVPASPLYPSSSLFNGRPGLRLPIGRYSRSCFGYPVG